MKLPGWKEREGTSMAGAMMDAQIRPNVREHKAAQQNFIAAEDPNDYLKIAQLEAEQWDSITKGIKTVAQAGMKVYEAHDNSQRAAASSYVKTRMAEWTNNTINNTPNEMTDPNTGETIRPWDNMEADYNAQFERVKAEARQKYGFTIKGNEDQFEMDTMAYQSSYGMKLADKKRAVYEHESFLKGMEVINACENDSCVWQQGNAMANDGIIGAKELNQIVMKRGGEFAKRDMQREFMNVPLSEIENVRQRVFDNPRYRKYLDDASMEAKVIEWNDTRASEVLSASVAEYLVSNPGDHDGARELLKGLQDENPNLFLEDAKGVATNAAIIEEIEDHESKYLKRLGEEIEATQKAERIVAIEAGDPTLVVTPEELNQNVQLSADMYQYEMQEKGTPVSDEEARAYALNNMLPAIRRYGILPEKEQNAIDLGSKVGAEPQVTIAGYLTREVLKQNAPGVIAAQDAGKDNLYTKLDARLDGNPMPSNEILLQMIEEEQKLQSVSETVKKSNVFNFKEQMKLPEVKATYYANVFDRAGLSYEEIGLDSDGNPQTDSGAAYLIRAEELSNEYARIYGSDTNIVQAHVARRLNDEFTNVVENGVLVPLRGQPEKDFTGGTAKEQAVIQTSLNFQRKQMIEAKMVGGEYLKADEWGYRQRGTYPDRLPSGEPHPMAGQKYYTLINLETGFAYVEETENGPLVPKFSFTNPLEETYSITEKQRKQFQVDTNNRDRMRDFLMASPLPDRTQPKQVQALMNSGASGWHIFNPRNTEEKLMLLDTLQRQINVTAKQEKWPDSFLQHQMSQATKFMMTEYQLTEAEILDYKSPEARARQQTQQRVDDYDLAP